MRRKKANNGRERQTVPRLLATETLIQSWSLLFVLALKSFLVSVLYSALRSDEIIFSGKNNPCNKKPLNSVEELKKRWIEMTASSSKA